MNGSPELRDGPAKGAGKIRNLVMAVITVQGSEIAVRGAVREFP
jgi:hypothetical protein